MTSRREFLHVGLAGSALLAISPLRHLFDGRLFDDCPPDRVYKAIFDERFSASVAFAREMQSRGTPVHGIRGDITALWYHDLHVAWTRAPIHVIGLTDASALFCLEMLARDAGHRVSSRQTVDGGLVSWSIGPRLRRPLSTG